MGKIIVKNVVRRKPGYLYYVDPEGNVCEAYADQAKENRESNALKKPLVKDKTFFRDLTFTFTSKPSMTKYSDFIRELIESEREQLNEVFNRFVINDNVITYLKKSKNNIQIDFDSQYKNISEGVLFGSLCLRKEGPVIFFPVKNIDALYVGHELSKESTYAQLVKTLIHELGHLYEKNEAKNRIFTDELLLKMDLSKFLNKQFSDLFYLKYVGQNTFNAMRKTGIHSLEDINEKNRDKLRSLPGSSDWHVNKWLQQVECIRKRKTGFYKTEKVEKILNNELLVFDIEKDAWSPDIFLVGVYNTENGEFIQFFDLDNEKRLLSDFINYADKYPKHILVSYGGNRFDELALLSGVNRYGLSGLNHDKIDIGIDVPNIIVGRLASSDYNLKSLAKFLGFKFKTNLNGFEVGLDFMDYKSGNKNIDWERIKLYNQDDVLATKHVIDKIKEELS